MEARSRPLSPHLQVYKPQLTSVLSISHRATGVALAAGTLLFVWSLAAAAAGPATHDAAQGFIGPSFGLLLLFGWSFRSDDRRVGDACVSPFRSRRVPDL